MELKKECGYRIKMVRKAKDFTQEFLGLKAGYTKQHICRLEKNHCPLSEDAADNIAKILGVRKEYLLCKDDFPTEADFKAELSRRTYLAFRSISLWSFGLHAYDLNNGNFALVDEKNPESPRICSSKELETLKETLDAIEETKNVVTKQFIDRSTEIDKESKEILEQILEERKAESQKLKHDLSNSITNNNTDFISNDFDIPFD